MHRDHSICICCADCHLFFIARDYVPVTASAFLNASWHNLLFLIPFGLFFYPVHIWMKREFGRWNDTEKKRG